MKYLIKIILIAFFANNAFSQSGWIQQYSGITDTINSVKFVNSTTGWCVGNNAKILKTTNGGNNWNLQEIYFDVDLYSVFFTSENTGYLAGDSNVSGFIGKTTNGGINWYSVGPENALSLRSVTFISNDIGFTSEYNENESKQAKIHKTINGGISWTSFESEAAFVFNIQFINETTGWLTGGGLIIGACWVSKTTNGGLSWNIQPQASRPFPFYCVTFIDSINGWVSGNGLLGYPLIMRSTNGGNNWVNAFPILNTNLYSIFFINKNKGWTIGDDKIILSTTNNGLNWTYQSLQKPGISYRSVYFTDSLNGWVVGDSGIILKTTTGGVLTGFSNTVTEIPGKYFLSQNYPNPFNPGTNLEFGIPYSGFITLKVYDVLGNQVAVLVNEKKNAGSYSIKFDGTNLSSGVYYYRIEIHSDRIEVNDFIQTKKMLLIK